MGLTTYIAFGANIGDVLKSFNDARAKLADHPEIKLKRTSKLYQTEPLTQNGEELPWYLNAVFEIETTLTLHKLFEFLQKIEMDLGRTKRKKWASRIIDLDILFFGSVIYKDKYLSIPHPPLVKRRFVLKPLCDLIPDFIHPEYDMTIKDLLSSCEDQLEVIPLEAGSKNYFQEKIQA